MEDLPSFLDANSMMLITYQLMVSNVQQDIRPQVVTPEFYVDRKAAGLPIKSKVVCQIPEIPSSL